MLEYEGSGFSGWQRQKKDVSVQQVLEEAIEKFSGETVRLHVAGRTDAGVHARAQVAHFDLESTHEARAVMGAINFHARPHRVVVTSAQEVPETFHARFGAKARSYRYLLMNRRPPLAIMAGRVWHLPKPLELAPMQEAANLLLGTHDFSTFRAFHCQAKSPVKTLDRFTITQDGTLFTFDIGARSFLYHQVRNMVGSLTLVGSGRWTVQDFAEAFAAKDRTKGGPTAPPEGLYFWEVSYDEPENKELSTTQGCC